MKAQPLKGRPLVSVVVPCYNYGRYLPDAVGSVLDQPDVDVEVIIVDDASTDDSADVAEELAGDPRVTLIKHEANLGHIATYNDGLSRVTGDLVVLLSADDLLVPGSLARAAALFEAYPEVGLVYGGVAEFADVPQQGAQDSCSKSSWTVWRGHEWLRIACLRGRNFILSPEVVVRSSALRMVGLYNAKLPHSGDLEYWLRVSEWWHIGRINGAQQALYRIHPQSMHRTTFGAAALDLEHRLEAFRAVNGMMSLDPRRRHLLVFSAERSVRKQALSAARRILDSGGGVEEALELIRVWNDAHKAGPRLRRQVLRKLRRARQGRPPARMQRVVEFLRAQAERLHWAVWRRVGIS
ncbi:glycosyltransferase [Sinomonas soli]